MNRRERFAAALRGAAVDRPPCTAWIHFATDALSPEETARRHQLFMQTYGWDFCKLMNDYRFPLPEGVLALESVAEMRRFQRMSMSAAPFAKQLEVHRALRAALGPDVPIVDTSFDPFQQVVRKVGYSRAKFIYANKDEALKMLDAVTETMCDFMRAIKAAGCDGVFYAINGAIVPPHARGIDDETFETFLRPFDLRVLEAMEGMARIVHVHGNPVSMKRVLDYPCEAFSVSDRLRGNPSLAELRAMTGKCLMGGVNEELILERSVPELQAEIADAIKQAGPRNFILSPGCTLQPQTAEHMLRALAGECAQQAA